MLARCSEGKDYGVTGGTYEGEDLGKAPEGEEESEKHCGWFVVVKEGGGELVIGGVVVVAQVFATMEQAVIKRLLVAFGSPPRYTGKDE